MGFARRELEGFRDATVPDLVGPACRLLFVGINPGLWTAATGTHFCHPTNRFYPALLEAGLIDWSVDSDLGMTDGQRADILSRNIGITNLVARATARASELGVQELREGADRLSSTVRGLGPRVVAVVGVTAYRTAFSRAGATVGVQPENLSGSELWVVPNPSGLNAHETVGSLADWYRLVGEAAGLS